MSVTRTLPTQARAREELKKFDDYAHAVTTITEPHRMIHDGYFFNMSGVSTALASGGTFDIFFRVPAGTIGHMILVEFTLEDAPCMVTFHENTTTSDDGTECNIRNHNRIAGTANSDATAVVATFGPTVTAAGDILDSRYVPSVGGLGGQTAGMLVAGEDAEWVIGSPTEETTYMWRLTNNSGGAIDLGYHFNGYQIGYPAKSTSHKNQ